MTVNTTASAIRVLIADDQTLVRTGFRMILEIEPDLERALERGLELTEPGAELAVLPTYTAMLRLRAIATQRGLTRPYWES